MRVLVAANQGLAGRLEITLRAAGAETTLVTDPARAISQLQTSEDIVLLDYDMSGLGGTRAVQLVRSLLGTRPLGVIYGLVAPDVAHRALAAGATGILPDDLDTASMQAALALLEEGQRFAIFSGTIPITSLDAAATLTDRELQVLHAVCDGLQNKEIAHRLGISEVTVKMHVRAIIRKLDARNRTHAAMIARDMKIV